jgi:hypothetical protein
MTPETAEAIIASLKVFAAPQVVLTYEMDRAAMWVIYEVWRNWGDRYFGDLDGTWAGEVLARMRAHYAWRQEARRVHEARQGVKKRDWKG